MNKQRLLKLANHLLHGKLGHERFDFRIFHKNHAHKKGFCGTAGCALGECPVVFPSLWKFHDEDVALRGRHRYSSFGSARIFFDLELRETYHLFRPCSQQYTGEYGGRKLNNNATRQQVAKNILAFIKKMEKK